MARSSQAASTRSRGKRPTRLRCHGRSGSPVGCRFAQDDVDEAAALDPISAASRLMRSSVQSA